MDNLLNRIELPALGPPFISADDAARFAHEAIGDKRDREYGGLILQREDGRFVATRPVAGEQMHFDFKKLLAMDAQGNFLHPAGYTCQALYHSHPAGHAEVKKNNPGLSDDQVALVVSFYSEFDKLFMFQHRAFAPAYYLSGSPTSLLKYVPSGSPAELLLALEIAKGRAEGTFTYSEEPIDELAKVGALSLVFPDELWGNRRGQFDGDWAIREPANTLQVATEQPFCSPVFDDPAEALGAIMNAGSAALGFDFMGFVLKASGKDEYVATYPWRDHVALFAALDDYPRREAGGPRLPSGFRLDGIYYVEHVKPGQSAKNQAWLYKRFFSPAALATVIAQSRKDIYLQDPQRGLTVYMRTQGKALLSYTCSGSAAETDLLAGATLQKALKAGTLSPYEFVLQVAAAGRLLVVQPGELWDRAGPVGQDWRPFERIHQSLSPAFVTADDAARWVHYQMRDRRDSDHLGFVLERSDGRFFATAPITASNWAKDWGLPYAGGLSEHYIELPGLRYVAMYKTLADNKEQHRRDKPNWSEDRIDLLTSLPGFATLAALMSGKDPLRVVYNSSAEGSLVKYTCSSSPEERNFGVFLENGLSTGAVIIGLDGFDGTAMQMVKKLVRLGELQVLISSNVWRGSRGKVPGSWIAYQPFTAAAPPEPAFSWVFQDPTTAAQWAHDRMQAKPAVRQLAFLLKSTRSAEYVVSEPHDHDAARGLPLFSPLQVFTVDDAGQPRLPPDLAIHGLCYQALPDKRRITEQPWLYESFLSATDFAQAIGTSRVRKTPGLALYLSTRDGAQLRYAFSGSAQESQLYSVNPHGVVADNGEQAELEAGTLSPEAFVRRVAAAGALTVLRAGRLWDVEGPVGLTWQPFASLAKPQLSPAFLAADDAARYAHERIGTQRDYEFRGYVLEREDGRFVVTEPQVVAQSARFAPGQVYPVDAAGKPILPPGYVLRATYASCLALSLYDPQRMQRHAWNREQACLDAQLFSDADLYAILRNRQHAPLAYLSCAEDALIAYDSSGTQAENVLLSEVTPTAKGSRMAEDLARGAMTPEDVVKQLASAGSLRVVIGNPLWGARGVVPEYWQAFAPAKAFQTPEQVAFGALYSDANAAASAAHQRVQRCGPQQTCFAFILKHVNRDEYVVSETVPVSAEQPLFALASLFRSDDSGAVEFPPAFKLHGLFYARQWLPKKLATAAQWLGRHFLSSEDLYTAFFEARRLRPEGAKTGLPVYLSTLDQALLKYQAPNSTTLFNPRIQTSGVAEDVHTQLRSGQLSAKRFVTQVITQSWLSVVVGNELWGEASPARLAADWKPYPRFLRRALTPAYVCQVDAIRHVARLLGAAREQIHAGLVLKRGDGLFMATEPLPLFTEDFDPKWILPDEDVELNLLAPGCKIVGRYRSRVASELPFLLPSLERPVYRDLFSTEVLATALASDHLWTHEYLLGAEGSILGFSLRDAEHDLLATAQKSRLAADVALLESQLAPSTDAAHDPWSNLLERRMRNGVGTPTELVNRLIRVGALHVVQGSRLWGQPRKLQPGWRPLPLGYTVSEPVRVATADQALSPAFCQADDAVRHAHAQAGAREHWRFGFVLTSARLAHSVVSLPVSADDGKFPYERVFLRGQLPTGYSMQGLYLCAPARQPEELPQSPVYRNFIPPSVLSAAQAMVEVIAAQPGARYKSLYLSCADGALLKYDARERWASDLPTHAQMTAYVQSLQGAGNPAEYIRKVAGSGELQVLERSATWATAGRVGADWTPGKVAPAPAADDGPLVLGPLCAHPDDAARWMWQRVRHARDKAWLGAIVRDAGQTNFAATEPLDDSGPTVPLGPRTGTPAYSRLFAGVLVRGAPSHSKKYPPGYTLMGVQQIYKVDDTPQSFSSPFEAGLYRNFVAHDEIRACIALLGNYAIADSRYYLTPRNGALLAYAPSYLDAESTVLLNDWKDVENGVTRSKLTAVLNTLILSGRLQILEPDRFWQPRGPLTARLLLEMSRRAVDA
jgi:hypothetical protein